METKLLKANDESIALACELLIKGEVVAVPTETVYGLAGDSSNDETIHHLSLCVLLNHCLLLRKVI